MEKIYFLIDFLRLVFFGRNELGVVIKREKLKNTEPTMRSMKHLEKVKSSVKNNLFLLTVLGGVIIGVFSGLLLRSYDITEDVKVLISYPGELFMRALKLIVLPFLICCLIVGSAKLEIQKNQNIAVRTLLFFVGTCILNVAIGIAIVVIVHPGNPHTGNHPHHTAAANEAKVNILDGFLDMGRNIIPENIFQATFEQTYTKISKSNVNGVIVIKKTTMYRDGMNTIGIIFVCLVFGSILGTLPSRGGPVLVFFATCDKIFEKILYAIVTTTPLGIASIVCSKLITVTNLWLTLTQLGLFVFELAASFLLYQLVVIQLIYFVIIRKNPFKYYSKLYTILATAFATASKAASLPIAFQVLSNKIKMNKKIVNFILPVGAINMNGSALYLPQAVIFLAQLNNSNLQLVDYITIGLGCMSASFSSAAVPTYSIVLVTMLCSVINIPTENVGLLLAVDWLVDRFRAPSNILGDCYAVAVVQHLSQKDLVEDKSELVEVKSTMDENGTNQFIV